MDSSRAGRIYFDTDTLPERDRFPAFCEEFVRRRTALDIVKRGEGPFRGVMDFLRAGPVVVGSHFSTPTDGDDSFLVALCRSGVAYLTQLGADLKLEPGSAFVCDSGYAGEVHITADTWLSLVRIPRIAMTKLLPRAVRLAGATLDRNNVARRLLYGYLGWTLDVVPEDHGRAMQLYGEHILDLIVLALGAEGEAREFVEQRSVGAIRRDAIIREIGSRSDDPGLNATTIAAQIGVTPRYVHLLLEETGKSFTHHVLERRLDKVATLLRDPRWRQRKIADIAAEAGFTDLSYFNRSFRRHYRATPSDIRNAARD
jgi:AraC-like DNA-binding protein